MRRRSAESRRQGSACQSVRETGCQTRKRVDANWNAGPCQTNPTVISALTNKPRESSMSHEQNKTYIHTVGTRTRTRTRRRHSLRGTVYEALGQRAGEVAVRQAVPQTIDRRAGPHTHVLRQMTTLRRKSKAQKRTSGVITVAAPSTGGAGP